MFRHCTDFFSSVQCPNQPRCPQVFCLFSHTKASDEKPPQLPRSPREKSPVDTALKVIADVSDDTSTPSEPKTAIEASETVDGQHEPSPEPSKAQVTLATATHSAETQPLSPASAVPPPNGPGPKPSPDGQKTESNVVSNIGTAILRKYRSMPASRARVHPIPPPSGSGFHPNLTSGSGIRPNLSTVTVPRQNISIGSTHRPIMTSTSSNSVLNGRPQVRGRLIGSRPPGVRQGYSPRPMANKTRLESTLSELIVSPKRWETVTFDPTKAPILPVDINTVIPYQIRQSVVSVLYNYFNQLLKTLLAAYPSLAHLSSLEKEKMFHDTSTRLDTYKNQMALFTSRMKQEIQKLASGQVPRPLVGILSFLHDEVVTIVPRLPFSMSTRAGLYGRSPATGKDRTFAGSGGGAQATASIILSPGALKPYIMTLEQQEQHGYPLRSHLKASKPFPPPDTWHGGIKVLTCSRCKKEFVQYADPSRIDRSGCMYHPQSVHKKQGSYMCCRAPQGSEGCRVGAHVYEISGLDEVTGFVETPENDSPSLEIAALDCEMGYTVGGMELIRLSVVNAQGTLVLDETVNPKYPVVDLNTQFSGVSSLENASHTLESIRSEFLSLISPETILIGHSLNSDLKALKMVHPTTIDTCVLFPHHRGLPLRYSLKALASRYLQKFIQQATARHGHDSTEDAIAALDLVRYKLGYDSGIRNTSTGGFVHTNSSGAAASSNATPALPATPPKTYLATGKVSEAGTPVGRAGGVIGSHIEGISQSQNPGSLPQSKDMSMSDGDGDDSDDGAAKV